MKKRLIGFLLCAVMLVSLLPVSAAAAGGVPLTAEYFPSEAIRNYLLAAYDRNKDRSLSEAELADATIVSCPGEYIGSLQGLEYLTELQYLDVSACVPVGEAEDGTPIYSYVDTGLTKIDLSRNPELLYLDVSGNKASLNIAGNSLLQYLIFGGCTLESFDLSVYPDLVYADLGSRLLSGGTKLASALRSVSVSGNKSLAELYLDGASLTKLDVSACPALQLLSCRDNALSTLDLSKNAALLGIDVSGNPISALDVSACPELAVLICADAKLTQLNVVKNKLLSYLDCGGNAIAKLDLKGLYELSVLDVSDQVGKTLTQLDLSDNAALTELYCENSGLQALDLQSNRKLTALSCGGNAISNLDLHYNTKLVSILSLDQTVTGVKLEKSGDKYTTNISRIVGYENMFRAVNVQGCEFNEVIGVIVVDSADAVVSYDFETGLGDTLSHVTVHFTAADDPVLPTCPQAKFSDKLPEDHWAHESIDYVLNRGIMSGTSDTTFDPNGTVTRAMVAVMLHNLAGEPAATIKHPFTDVKDSDWFAPSVTWAYENGVVSGNEDGTFNPDGKITREQLAIMMCNFADFKGLYKAADFDLSRFADQSSVSPWAVDAIKWACANGIVSGSDDGSKLYLLPLDTATRMQMAVIFQNFCETFGI